MTLERVEDEPYRHQGMKVPGTGSSKFKGLARQVDLAGFRTDMKLSVASGCFFPGLHNSRAFPHDPSTTLPHHVVKFEDRARIELEVTILV